MTALHVYTSLVPALVAHGGRDRMPPVLLADIDREPLLAEATRFVDKARAPDVPIEIVLADAADVPREIVARAGTSGADLIVIGSHGRSGFQHLILGSVTERVLRNAPCAALTVPRLTPDAVPAAQGIFTRILCAIDLSAPSLAALDYGLSLAATSGAELIVLHVMEVLPEAHEPFIDAGRRFAAERRAHEARCVERLGQMLSMAAPPIGRVEKVVVTGKPYKEILALAHARGCDLIVVGVHARNAIERTLSGSTAQQVVRQASCPVLTVPSQPQSGWRLP